MISVLIRRIAFGACASALAMGIALAAPSAQAADAISGKLWQEYGAAIRDSVVALPSEVVTDLALPDPSNPLTQWKEIDGEQYLLMSNMRFAPLTDAAPGSAFSLKGDTWVSIAGEIDRECVKAGCLRMNASRLDLRLKQLLGLPPDASYGYVTRIWVRPADLFRPCTDPRVTSATCPARVPADAPTTIDGVDLAQFMWKQANDAWRLPDVRRHSMPVSCAADYKDERKGQCAGYPWTRLGYTYDWAPSAPDDRGVTEFVIPRGTTVYLDSSGPQRDYYPSAASAAQS